MSQHLLVAHDLSPQSDIALQRAARLRRQLGGRVSVLHVLNAAADEPDCHWQLQQRLQAAGLDGAELHLRRGPAADGILSMLQALQADLLLIGAHHSGLSAGFAASTPELLLQACPALLVAVDAGCADWTQGLALLDFSPCASRALRLARHLLPASAPLVALNVLERAAVHAGDDPAELQFQHELFQRLLEDERQALGQTSQLLAADWQVGELHHCLQQAIAQHRPQLLALGEHHRGLLADSLLGSLTIELLQAPPCDLLITR